MAKAPKKTSPKADPKSLTDEAENVTEQVAEVVIEQPKPELPYTASALAKMGSNAKASIKAGADNSVLDDVIEAHRAYLRAVSKGAEASPEDQRFVQAHLSALRSQFGV